MFVVNTTSATVGRCRWPTAGHEKGFRPRGGGTLAERWCASRSRYVLGCGAWGGGVPAPASRRSRRAVWARPRAARRVRRSASPGAVAAGAGVLETTGRAPTRRAGRVRRDLQDEREEQEDAAAPPARLREQVAGLPRADQRIGRRAGAAEAGGETAALPALEQDGDDEDDASRISRMRRNVYSIAGVGSGAIEMRSRVISPCATPAVNPHGLVDSSAASAAASRDSTRDVYAANDASPSRRRRGLAPPTSSPSTSGAASSVRRVPAVDAAAVQDRNCCRALAGQLACSTRRTHARAWRWRRRASPSCRCRWPTPARRRRSTVASCAASSAREPGAQLPQHDRLGVARLALLELLADAEHRREAGAARRRRTCVAVCSSVSPNTCRRSEWPTSTSRAPASRAIGAESLAGERALRLPVDVLHADQDVGPVAQRLGDGVQRQRRREEHDRAVVRVGVVREERLHERRASRRAVVHLPVGGEDRLAHGHRACARSVERVHAGQRLALEELERRAAAGGHVAHLVARGPPPRPPRRSRRRRRSWSRPSSVASRHRVARPRACPRRTAASRTRPSARSRAPSSRVAMARAYDCDRCRARCRTSPR